MCPAQITHKTRRTFRHNICSYGRAGFCKCTHSMFLQPDTGCFFLFTHARTTNELIIWQSTDLVQRNPPSHTDKNTIPLQSPLRCRRSMTCIVNLLELADHVFISVAMRSPWIRSHIVHMCGSMTLRYAFEVERLFTN